MENNVTSICRQISTRSRTGSTSLTGKSSTGSHAAPLFARADILRFVDEHQNL